MAFQNRLLNSPPDATPLLKLTIDGTETEAPQGSLLIDAINQTNTRPTTLAQVCYHPQLGPIGTCDTCMVEVNGKLTRACTCEITAGLNVQTQTKAADAAQREAYDRILGNHLLYCTVCDNNNENCTVHNTCADLDVKHQAVPYKTKPYEQDRTNPFYRYDPDQCILCGRCVEACQNVQVNETLTIDWTSPHPRVLWDGGHDIAGSSCVSCGHCVTVCPCNALMEKSMLGRAGYFTNLSPDTLDDMIEVVKDIEPQIGYGPILSLSELEADMRELRVKKTKTVCTYCGVGCSFDVWTKDRHILKIEPGPGPANGISTCVKGKFALGLHQLRRPPHQAPHPPRRSLSSNPPGTKPSPSSPPSSPRSKPPTAPTLSPSSPLPSAPTKRATSCRSWPAPSSAPTTSITAPATAKPPPPWAFRAPSSTAATPAPSPTSRKPASSSSSAPTQPRRHPVLATRVKRSHKLRGQRLIVADLRKHEMAERADLFVRPNPSTDPVWINAVAKYLLDHNLAKLDFIDKWVNNFDDYKESLAPFTLEYAEHITGIPAADI